DPQPRDLTEVNYFAHDVLEELVGTSALFAITLGDLTFDAKSNYPAINQAVGKVGIPFYHTIGNHDANYDGADTYEHYETWRTYYGPRYYSFDHGPVHFIILADVLYPEGGTRYIAGLGERQLEWLENDLSFVPQDQLIVVNMHIQLTGTSGNPDFNRMYELLQDYPNTVSFSAHSHTLTHSFLNEENGWMGAEPHHHINAGASCGRWWDGNKDETDIPHTTSSDGTPNGYFVVTFDRSTYSTRYKAARRPADYQMQIQAPDEVTRQDLADTPVLVNVFNGSERSSVEMAVGDSGVWVQMEFAPQVDPLYAKVAREQSNQRASRSNHMWEGSLPVDLKPGGHLIRIRTTDMHGQVFTGSRIIRVND
ncbi:calcineurin-like phosphoesterase C-terminal domain-containing protein, partial [Gemmatimonadota bacterium]